MTAHGEHEHGCSRARALGELERRPRGRATALAITATIAAAVIAPASASGAAFLLTDDPAAHHPDVVIDGEGTAHVAWESGQQGIVHCRVPLGARACADTRSLGIEGASSGLNINRMPSGELVITSEGHWAGDIGWDANRRVYAFTSADGGQTFAGPRRFADPASIWSYGGVAAPGPGGAFLSLLGVGGGANTPLRYSAVPFDAVVPVDENGDELAETPSASLTEWSKGYSPSTALADPSTPIVASRGLDGMVYYRGYSGSGDVNDEGSWLAERSLAGSEPHLAGGPSGAFLIYTAPGNGPNNTDEFEVAPYDPASSSFGPGTVVSAIDGAGVFSGRLAQGSDGILHLVTSEFADKDRLLYRHNPDGREPWRPIVALVQDVAELPGGGDFPGDDFWDIRIDAGPAGTGAAVFTTNQGAGPLLFAPFDAAASRGSALKVGGGKLRLRPGRKLKTRVACRRHAVGDCVGRVVVKTRRSFNLKGRTGNAQLAKARRVRLARTRFEIPAGKSRKLKLQLPRRNARLVRKRRRARKANVIVRARDRAGNRVMVKKKARVVPKTGRKR